MLCLFVAQMLGGYLIAEDSDEENNFLVELIPEDQRTDLKVEKNFKRFIIRESKSGKSRRAGPGIKTVKKRKAVARMSTYLPPQHWSYTSLSELVKYKLIHGVPIFHFQGGKTFKRGEIAKLIKKSIEDIKKGTSVPERHLLTHLITLSNEFAPELRKLKADVDLGYISLHKIKDASIKAEKLSRQHKGWNWSGSNTAGWVNEIENSVANWDDNLVLNAVKGNSKFNISITGRKENLTETSPGLREFDVGDQGIVGVDKYSLEMEKHFSDQKVQLYSILGFTGGSSFSEGLTVGNLNLEGGSLTGNYRDRREFDVVLGRTQGDLADELFAIHLKERYRENIVFHVQGVGALYHPESTSGARGLRNDHVLGLGAEITLRDYLFSMESSSQRGGNSAHYIKLNRTFLNKIDLNLEYRHYDGINFEFHSPDVYSGISGGDDVLDRGLGFESEYQLREDLLIVFNGDSSFDGVSGDFLYLYQELNYEKDKYSGSIAYEREWNENLYHHITTLRLGCDWAPTFKSSLDWSREYVDGAGSHSTRLAFVYDYLKDIISTTYSITNRHSDSGRDLTQQLGWNWNINMDHFMSIQSNFSVPDKSSNTIEASYLLKF